MIKQFIFLLALANMIAMSLTVYRGKKDMSVALSILEIILVFFWFTV